jgi:hypothetical protein
MEKLRWAYDKATNWHMVAGSENGGAWSALVYESEPNCFAVVVAYRGEMMPKVNLDSTLAKAKEDAAAMLEELKEWYEYNKA